MASYEDGLYESIEFTEFLLNRLESNALSFKDVHSKLQLLAHSYGSRNGSLSLLRRDAVRLNRHAPVNKLPNELLCAIFRSLGQDALRNTPSRVCSRWRIVALGDTSLWTNMVISTRAQVEKAVPVIVQRARGTGLRVRFFVPRSTEESRKKDDVRARWPSYVQCANVLAGHVRELHIGGEVTTPSSHIATFVSRLLEFQGNVQLVGVSIGPDYGLSAVSSRQSIKGRPTLRSFSTTVPFLPGNWLRNLTHLDILYQIAVVPLLYIVAYAPTLESLSAALPAAAVSTHVNAQHLPPLPVAAMSLNNFSCYCRDGDPRWKTVLEYINPQGRCVARIAIPNAVTPVDVTTSLLRGIDTIRVLHLSDSWSLGGKPLLGISYTLADTRGRRRHFCLKKVSPQRDSLIRREIFESGDLLRNVTHLTIPACFWNTVNELLGGGATSMELRFLHTINFILETVSTMQQNQKNLSAVMTKESYEFGSSVVLQAPTLREISLVITPDKPNRYRRAIISPKTATCYVCQLAYDTQNPPLLRLVNASLGPGLAAALRLRRSVGRIVESSWDCYDSRLKWAGVPEYVFGWGE